MSRAARARPIARWDGLPVKISHIVLHSPNHKAAVQFFVDVLGFRVADWLGDFMAFLRCNSAHHRFAILPGPPCLNHVAYDMTGVDGMMRGDRHRLKKLGVEITWGPGRHTAGNNTFSYFVTPNRFAVEYTAELEEVDDATWQPKVHEAVAAGDGPVGDRRRRPAHDAASEARSRPVPAGGGLKHGAVRILPELRLEPVGRDRAGERRPASARSSTCARRSASAAGRGEDAGTREFLAEWVKKAETLAGACRRGRGNVGRAFSAAAKLQRAALYLFTAERMQGHGHPGREATYARAQRNASTRRCARSRERANASRCRSRAARCPRCSSRAAGDRPAAGRASTATASTAARSCSTGRGCRRRWRDAASPRCASTSRAPARRCDCRDCPRRRTANAGHRRRSTGWSSSRRSTPRRIGMTGISLGGHFAPRAVAFEPRFASGAVWGANHNWAEVQQKRLRREGENPVPHYWNHVQWVFGATRHGGLPREGIRTCTSNGVMERIRVPFLVTHGEKDRQISVDYAHQSYEQLVNSPRRELKIFTAREGGVEHVGADNMAFGRDYIADWFAETLGGHYAHRSIQETDHDNAPFRRIVTGHDAQGRAVILEDGAATARSSASAASTARCSTRSGTRARRPPASIARRANRRKKASSWRRRGMARASGCWTFRPRTTSLDNLTPEEARAHFAEVGAADASSHSGQRLAATPSCTAPKPSTTASCWKARSR